MSEQACKKCGEQRIGTRYRDSVPDNRGLNPDIKVKPYLERECWTCGYRWAEKPLDERASP